MTTRIEHESVRFVKGHGTQNDFVLIDDPDGALAISPEQVARLCDRQQGLGADGLIRVVRTAALLGQPDAAIPGPVLAGLRSAPVLPEWFMDYRNGDGSVAQMCGNGVRVFAAHLAARGWVATAGAGTGFTIGTRAGIKSVHQAGGAFGVDLGPWRVNGGTAAVSAGADALVTVPPLADLPDQAHLAGLPGLGVDLGNPHMVVALPTLAALRSLDLTSAPRIDPQPAEGANVEFIVPQHSPAATAAGEGHLVMRVFERGVGETRSCGTGAVAAVIAARAWAGPDAPTRWIVDVPGGRLRIELPAGAPLDAGLSAGLSGPAVLVAEGHLLPGRWTGPDPADALDHADELQAPGAVTLSTR